LYLPKLHISKISSIFLTGYKGKNYKLSEWQNWQDWSECSLTCGNEGFKRRIRVCVSPSNEKNACPSTEQTEAIVCNEGSCEGMKGTYIVLVLNLNLLNKIIRKTIFIKK